LFHSLSDPLFPALRRIPPPSGDVAAPLRLLLFDAFHDDYRGVVCLVKVVDGRLAAGDKLQAASTGKQYEALEVGRPDSVCFVFGACMAGGGAGG
jgi:translation elongation factor EF-4